MAIPGNGNTWIRASNSEVLADVRGLEDMNGDHHGSWIVAAENMWFHC
jgi:hypothetical protein